MARILLRLRLRLLANALHRGTSAALGLLLGGLVGLGFALLAAATLTAAGTTDVWAEVAVVAFAAVWVGWLLLPMLSFTSDDTLDPRKFALLPLTPRALVPGLLLGALVGIGAIATLIGVSGAVFGTWRATGSVTATGISVVAVVLLVLASVASSRALLTLAADALGSRRGRDVATLLGGLVMIAAVAAGQVFPRLSPEVFSSELLGQVAAVVRWTPGGFVGAAVAGVADGDLVTAVLRLAAVAVWIVAMLALWALALGRVTTTSPQRRTTATRARAGLYPRPLAWLPRTRTTAVAVRFLRSLARDPRVRAQALSQAFIVVPMLALSVGAIRGATAPLVAVYLVVPFGLLAANQLGLDGPALWQHHLAGHDLRSDLLGRDLALAVLAVPAATVAAVALAVTFEAWALLPVAVLLSVATLLTMLGVSNAAAVTIPFPVPEDASNPFASSGSGSMGAGCLQALLMAGLLLFHAIMSLPILLAALLPQQPGVRLIVATAAVVYGTAVLAGGTALAVARGRGRGAELLAAVDPRAR